MEKLLSVIIPVYNGEKYISKCLDSILQQSYKNLELIIINDGSKDNSLKILQDYKEKDDRITLINQENQGTSITRNNALAYVKGEYLTFVDIDDYLEKDIYQSLMIKIDNNADIISYGASCDFEKENYSIIKKFKDSNDKNYIINELFTSGLFNPLWNKIYKTNLIKDKIYFPKEFNQGEDLIFNCKAYNSAKQIQNIDLVGYHYVYKQQETMVSKYTPNNEIVLEQKNKYVKELLKNSPQTYYDYMLKEYEVFVINLFLKGSPYSFSKKANLIKKYILTNYEVIKKANATSLYNKIFKFSALLNNAQILCVIYALLNFIKQTFSNTYLKIRKMIYKGKE